MGFVGKQDDNLQTPRFGSEPTSLDRRESVAAVLRRAREKHGQDVRTVAQVLRIRQAYIEALESGRFDRLPGTAYALGFLRTYAEYLGLNANNIVDRFKEEVQGPERHTELVFPEPVVEARIPGGAIILISVLLLGVAYGGWFYLSNQGRSVADLIPALPGQIQTLIEGEGEGAPPAPEPESPVVSAEAPPEAPLAEPSAGQVAEAPAPAQDEPAPAEPVQAEAPQVEPAVAEVTTAEALPEPAPVAPEPVPLEPAPLAVAEDTPLVATEPPQLTRPSLAPQVAAVPEPEDAAGGASDAYSGPPIDPAPAPELQAQNRADAPVLAPPLEYQALEAAPAPAPAMVPSPAPAPVQSAALPQALPQAPAEAPAAAEPQTEAFVEPTVVIPAPPTAPRSFAQPGERAPQVYGESNEDARIVLRALQDSWVQVRDGQDALLLTRVLRSGDVYRVPDQPGLTLLTGNAGGLALEVDGVRLPPLGPVGSVRRQIALDPSALLGRGQ